MHDVRHGVIVAYTSKALAAEAEWKRLAAPPRQEGAIVWHNAARYAWVCAEHGHIAAADVVNEYVDPHIIDRRFLATVYGDDIAQGEWSELHELLFSGALDVLNTADAEVGLLHHVVGLTVDEIAERLECPYSRVKQRLVSVRQKWDNLRDGKPTTPVVTGNGSKPERTGKAHTNHSSAQSAILAVVLEHAPVTTPVIAEKAGVDRKAAQGALRRLVKRGLVVSTGTEERTHGGGLAYLWQATDEGRRFASVAVAVETSQVESPAPASPEPVVATEKEEATVPSEVTGTQRDRVVAAMTAPFTASDVAKLLDVKRNRANTLLNTMHGHGEVEKIIHGPHTVMWELSTGDAKSPTQPRPQAKRPRKPRPKKRARVSVFASVRTFAVRAFDGCLRLVGLQRIGGVAR